MSGKPYIYRREDNGKLIRRGFDTVLQQDVAGFITLRGGVKAKRCLHLEGAEKRRAPRERVDLANRPIVSDAMGFPQHQFEDFEQDRQASGFSGVEFARDPRTPEFFQVKCSSRKEWDRYVQHRGMVDKNKATGVLLTQEDIDQAAELVRRMYA